MPGTQGESLDRPSSPPPTSRNTECEHLTELASAQGPQERAASGPLGRQEGATQPPQFEKQPQTNLPAPHTSRDLEMDF